MKILMLQCLHMVIYSSRSTPVKKKKKKKNLFVKFTTLTITTEKKIH